MSRLSPPTLRARARLRRHFPAQVLRDVHVIAQRVPHLFNGIAGIDRVVRAEISARDKRQFSAVRLREFAAKNVGGELAKLASPHANYRASTYSAS